jgi:hypothetical protein
LVTPPGSPVAEPLPVAICWKVAPPFVLRQTPMLPNVKASAMFTETTRVLPRAATPEMFLPTSTPPPLIAVQVAPPLVVRRRPVRAPPVEPKLLNRPMPATSVLRGGSVGSRSRAPIELEAWSSVRRVHLGFCDVEFVIFQTPPLTAPTYRVPAALGWATTV